MSPGELVEQLAQKESRLAAMKALVGGVTATELRQVHVDEEVFQALVRGTRHANPVVRWWSVELLDHCPDERAYEAVVPLFNDPVPRVRRQAAHAVGCLTCKPEAAAPTDDLVLDGLRRLATHDPNAKVRREAATSIRLLNAAPPSPG